MLDLDDLPLIDQHVHIFERESDQPTFDPLATFSLGGDWVDFLDSGGHKPTEQERNQLQVNQRQTMIYHEAMHAVAGYLGCEPNREAIIAARAGKAADYKAYVRGMYRDINLESNIVDLGHPKNVSLAEFEALTGVPAFGLLRIEPVIGEIWDQHDSLAGLEKAFEERLRKAAADPRIISLKTVIAYRTGLDLRPLASSSVSAAMDSLKQGPHAAGLFAKIHVPRSTRDDVKRVRDYLVWRALELSIELSLPFQIHTGMGDQDLDINTARPGLLAAVFRDEKLRHAKIILLHGAFPFYEEAAYLVNVFPNVYLDLSEFNPMIGPGVGRVITTILELAPFTKVVYSSDAFGSPELQWIAAKKGRQALSSALGAAVEAGNLSTSAARDAARLILADNVRRIYGLQAGKSQERR
jgi:hypothetical protein